MLQERLCARGEMCKRSATAFVSRGFEPVLFGSRFAVMDNVVNIKHQKWSIGRVCCRQKTGDTHAIAPLQRGHKLPRAQPCK